MQFSSPQFFIFLAIVLVVFRLLPGKIRAPWLLIASLFFYGSWNPICLIFLLFTTIIFYLAALKIENAPRKEPVSFSPEHPGNQNESSESESTPSDFDKKDQIVFILALLCSLAILFFFKYYDFTLQNINTIRRLFAPDAEPLQRGFDLLLPVGISFYTFQAISYLVDVKRGTIPAEHNFLYFGLYMAWFPKIVSGPIERAGHLLPQLHALALSGRHSFRKPSNDSGRRGFSLNSYRESDIRDNSGHHESFPTKEHSSPQKDFQPDDKVDLQKDSSPDDRSAPQKDFPSGANSTALEAAFSQLPPAEAFSSGFGLMLWGLFMKMILADRIAIFVDNVWMNLFACGTAETVLAALGYSIQIYCDFAGYSCIAVGVSRMFGIELIENFNTPCFARSISDFWHRWHISLSTWLRDYIYIPLGGSRCSRLRKYLNILVTFLVSGLWHGAAWTFIIWGLLHGLYQILGDLLKPLRRKFCSALRVNRNAFSFRFGQALITFLLVTFAWIFFRAGSLSQAVFFLQRMFTRWDPWVLFDEGIFQYGLDRREFNIFFVGLFALLLAGVIQARKSPESENTIHDAKRTNSTYNRKESESGRNGLSTEKGGSNSEGKGLNTKEGYSDSERNGLVTEKKSSGPGGMDMGRFLMTQNLAFRWAVYLALILIILIYGEYGVDFNSSAFIYSGF